MRPLLHVVLAGLLLSTASLPSMATAQKEGATTSPKKKTSTPKFIPSSSQETPKDRERRLLRECKGRPNAGACSGYAS